MDMNNTLEALAFMTELPIGIRPALGMDPKWEYQNEIEAGLSMFGTPIVPLKLVHDILFGEMSSKYHITIVKIPITSRTLLIFPTLIRPYKIFLMNALRGVIWL